MTDQAATAETGERRTDPDSGAQAGKGATAAGAAQTELRPAGAGPRPRSKVIPDESRDDDDLFNDMPV